MNSYPSLEIKVTNGDGVEAMPTGGHAQDWDGNLKVDSVGLRVEQWS